MRVDSEYTVNNKAVQVSNVLHAILTVVLIGSVVKIGSFFLSDVPVHQRILFFLMACGLVLALPPMIKQYRRRNERRCIKLENGSIFVIDKNKTTSYQINHEQVRFLGSILELKDQYGLRDFVDLSLYKNKKELVRCISSALGNRSH